MTDLNNRIQQLASENGSLQQEVIHLISLYQNKVVHNSSNSILLIKIIIKIFFVLMMKTERIQ